MYFNRRVKNESNNSQGDFTSHFDSKQLKLKLPNLKSQNYMFMDSFAFNWRGSISLWAIIRR